MEKNEKKYIYTYVAWKSYYKTAFPKGIKASEDELEALYY